MLAEHYHPHARVYRAVQRWRKSVELMKLDHPCARRHLVTLHGSLALSLLYAFPSLVEAQEPGLVQKIESSLKEYAS